MPRNPKIAFEYLRVSTDHQDNSMVMQTNRHADYAKFQGIVIKRTFQDPDVTGRMPLSQRPGGSQLLEILRLDPTIGSVIVLKLDRLGRKATDVINTMERFEEMGIALHIADFGGDAISTQGAAGKLLLTIMAAVAEWEVETICERITGVLDDKFSRHEVIGTVPFGWDGLGTGRFKTRAGGDDIEVRELIPNPIEQHWLEHIHRLRAEGETLKGIAEWLNDQGALTKTGPLGSWRFSTISKILGSKHYKRWSLQREEIMRLAVTSVASVQPMTLNQL